MNIAGIDYDLNNKALCIYISGCKAPHCPGCHNSSLWDFNKGENWCKYEDKMKEYISTDMVKYVWILGGEPLDNNQQELEALIVFVSMVCNNKVMLWTRYELNQVPDNILQYLDYIKTGEYQCDSESYRESVLGITLASKNQKVIKLR